MSFNMFPTRFFFKEETYSLIISDCGKEIEKQEFKPHSTHLYISVYISLIGGDTEPTSLLSI